MIGDSYAEFEQELEKIKASYKTKLYGIINKFQLKQDPSLEEITEYIDSASRYFYLTEKYVPKILHEKKMLRGAKISSFADDCFTILETYLNHIKLLDHLLKIDGTINRHAILPTKVLTNTQRMVRQYSTQGIDDLKNKFIDLKVSTHGFDEKQARDELDMKKMTLFY